MIDLELFNDAKINDLIDGLHLFREHDGSIYFFFVSDYYKVILSNKALKKAESLIIQNNNDAGVARLKAKSDLIVLHILLLYAFPCVRTKCKKVVYE
jgi:hypothetical protein